MPDAKLPESLDHFLRCEFEALGLEGASPLDLRIETPYHVERDRFGCTLTCHAAARSPAEALLHGFFGAHVFNAEGTAIFRRDDKSVTAMLAEQDGRLQIIILVWKDPGVRADMETARDEALKSVLRDAAAEAARNIDACHAAADSDSRDRCLGVAVNSVDELVAAMERLGECGRSDAQGKSTP